MVAQWLALAVGWSYVGTLPLLVSLQWPVLFVIPCLSKSAWMDSPPAVPHMSIHGYVPYLHLSGLSAVSFWFTLALVHTIICPDKSIYCLDLRFHLASLCLMKHWTELCHASCLCIHLSSKDKECQALMSGGGWQSWIVCYKWKMWFSYKDKSSHNLCIVCTFCTIEVIGFKLIICKY